MPEQSIDSISNDISGNLLSWIKAHPGFVLTASYLFASCLGFIYQVKLYSQFNLNIVNYSLLEDFFVAWLSDISSISYTFSIFLIFFATYLGSAVPWAVGGKISYKIPAEN